MRSRLSAQTRTPLVISEQLLRAKTAPKQRSQFSQLNATELYCPKCKQAMPVKERLLLVLGSGDLYEYSCARCGESLGNKTG